MADTELSKTALIITNKRGKAIVHETEFRGDQFIAVFSKQDFADSFIKAHCPVGTKAAPCTIKKLQAILKENSDVQLILTKYVPDGSLFVPANHYRKPIKKKSQSTSRKVAKSKSRSSAPATD